MSIPSELLTIEGQLTTMQQLQQEQLLILQGKDTGTLLNTIASLQQLQGLQLNEIIGDLNGLAALLNQSYQSLVQGVFAIVDLIGKLPQVGQPVKLPVTPPAGYGGASAGAVATSVWLSPITLASGAAAGDVLAWSGVPGFLRGSVQDRIDYGFVPGWLVTTEWNNVQLAVDSTLPAIDWTTILPTDATPTAWADRVYTGFSPYSTDSLGRPFFNDGRPGAGYVYTIDMTSEHFHQLSGSGSSVVVAPVWPGIAGVTLGSPVALSPTLVVTGPMHGVIIEITSAAPRQVYQVFGGMQGYRFVGGLQFVDDNGEAERIQSIGMQHEVILCKSMAEAASCSIRTDSAVTGTATPFVVT